MRQRLRALRANESGFTLTELLIVIVILGVLTGIVVFAVAGITDRGEEAACKSDVKSVEVALEAYYAQEGNYPDGSGGSTPMEKLVADKYLREPPNGGTNYNITLAPGGDLEATGACTHTTP